MSTSRASSRKSARRGRPRASTNGSAGAAGGRAAARSPLRPRARLPRKRGPPSLGTERRIGGRLGTRAVRRKGQRRAPGRSGAGFRRDELRYPASQWEARRSPARATRGQSGSPKRCLGIASRMESPRGCRSSTTNRRAGPAQTSAVASSPETLPPGPRRRRAADLCGAPSARHAVGTKSPNATASTTAQVSEPAETAPHLCRREMPWRPGTAAAASGIPARSRASGATGHSTSPTTTASARTRWRAATCAPCAAQLHEARKARKAATAMHGGGGSRT